MNEARILDGKLGGNSFVTVSQNQEEVDGSTSLMNVQQKEVSPPPPHSMASGRDQVDEESVDLRHLAMGSMLNSGDSAMGNLENGMYGSAHLSGKIPSSSSSSANHANQSPRMQLNKLHRLEARMNLALKWFHRQLEDVSTLHMDQRHKNSHLRAKYQSELRHLEEERLICEQNTEAYQREVERLLKEVEVALKEECGALRKGIVDERRRADEQLGELAKQLFK